MAEKPRRQCKKCPWRKEVDPRDIPNGYCERKHAALSNTIANPEAPSLGNGSPLRVMACHETAIGKEQPCVGWLVNQLGRGKNLQLWLAVRFGHISADVEPVGEQHATFADTLPKGFPR